MIPNCEGCKYEFQEACNYVKSGYHLATTKGRVGLREKKHFGLMIVDDNGKLIVW